MTSLTPLLCLSYLFTMTSLTPLLCLSYLFTMTSLTPLLCLSYLLAMAVTYFCGILKTSTPPQSSRNTSIGEHAFPVTPQSLSGTHHGSFPILSLRLTGGYSDASNRALGSVVMPYDPAATKTPRGPSYWFAKTGPNAGLIFQKYGHELSVKLLTLAQIRSWSHRSTLRELRGIVRMTLVHLAQWKGKHIRIFTDNAAVPKILFRGSSVLELHQLAREYLGLLARHNVKIRVIWIPSRDNMGSDLMSRQYAQALLDTEDYCLKIKGKFYSPVRTIRYL